MANKHCAHLVLQDCMRAAAVVIISGVVG